MKTKLKPENKILGSLVLDTEGLKSTWIKKKEAVFLEALRLELMEPLVDLLTDSQIRNMQDKGKKVQRSHHDLHEKAVKAIYKKFKKMLTKYY